MSASIPIATYRLQFHSAFTFNDARALVPYLHSLGISHVYASPIFRASPGSTHGYDVCDHNEINPELGSRADFDAFVAELHAHGLGLILDFVPNHMGIAEPDNRWWMDVLENGPASPYARFFDIDWLPLKRELENKVLLPILGDQYGRVLERGEMRVRFGEGRFWLEYYAMRLPLAPRSIRPVIERAAQLLPEAPAELASILTALEHLPLRTEIDPAKIAIRMREKEVIRRRLARLCDESPTVKAALDGAIAELHDPADASSFDRLDALISDQPYRLSSWRVAAEEINYRRFFDVNSLAALCMELPEVFDATHRLLLELIASSAVDGVRIDHIDGLADPHGYLLRLQSCAGKAAQREEECPIYLLVEKILGTDERLPEGWPIHGTTGYEFANDVTAILLDRTSDRALTDCYSKFIGRALDFQDIAYRSKQLVMQASLASEVNVLGHLLNRLSESNRWYRDFTVNALTKAIRAVIAGFPVYRTYLAPDRPPSDADAKIIQRAIARARRRNPALERSVFEFLRVVLLPPENNPHPVDEELRRSFVAKFQQCTGPIAAKGVEDTALYVFLRLAALNEVGGEPGSFGMAFETFHRRNAERLATFPHCMLATSTHDTKRSEDVRARLAALSEIPREWSRAVRRWHTLNRKHKRTIDGELAPDANEEFLLYQTLLGSWPLAPLDETTRAEYVRRIQDYMLKALHEAKLNSSWIEPNENWDEAVREFVAAILTPRRQNRFLPSFEPLAERIAQLGAINSITQTVLKLTVPGMPDFYQGSELWDFSLVDPDNRHLVDYVQRSERLASLAAGSSPAGLVESWRDGSIKLFVIRALLALRRDYRSVFDTGSYTPVTAEASLADCCIAFERSDERCVVLVVVPRLSSRVGFPPLGECWSDTVIRPASAAVEWVDVFTSQRHAASHELRAADIFREFPVAVLVAAEE